MWRRLVARYLGVVEAVGSSPVTQTQQNCITKPFVSSSRAALLHLKLSLDTVLDTLALKCSIIKLGEQATYLHIMEDLEVLI